MNMTVRNMTAGDVDTCFTLTQALKWPHRREDWQLAQQLGEGVVIEEHGKLIGSAILWRWGDKAATIGLVIVDNQMQGRGLGKQLMLVIQKSDCKNFTLATGKFCSEKRFRDLW